MKYILCIFLVLSSFVSPVIAGSEERYIFEVNEHNECILNGAKLSSLESGTDQLTKDSVVVILAHPMAVTDKVIKLLNAVRNSGVQNISLSTSRESNP